MKTPTTSETQTIEDECKRMRAKALQHALSQHANSVKILERERIRVDEIEGCVKRIEAKVQDAMEAILRNDTNVLQRTKMVTLASEALQAEQAKLLETEDQAIAAAVELYKKQSSEV